MIGIIPSNKMKGQILLSTVERVLHDALHLGALYLPLYNVLKQRARYLDNVNM
jgi:hypothetical protein